MNLYLIAQNTHTDYDTYDSAVVCARDVDEARHIHPGGTLYNPEYGEPWFLNQWSLKSWAHPDRVMVELIGVARDGIPAGVVCSSFNAG